jgi:Plant protein of unknown function
LDISFKKGTIEMPLLVIEIPSMRILWNMVAFEQSGGTKFLSLTMSSYLALMDSLISTGKDIAILERSGIVNNMLENAEAAANIFNQGCKRVQRVHLALVQSAVDAGLLQ